MAIIPNTLTTYDVDNHKEDYIGGVSRSGPKAQSFPVLGLSTADLIFTAPVFGADPLPQTIAIGNAGHGQLGPVTVEITYGLGSGWLTAVVAGSGNAQTVTFMASGTGVADTFSATASIVSITATNSPRSLLILFRVLMPSTSVTLGAGSFALTGQDLDIQHSGLHEVIQGAGSFAFTGQALDIRHTHRVVLGVGSFALTGQDLLISQFTATTLPLQSGVFVLASPDFVIRHTHRVVLGAGSFALTGRDLAINESSTVAGAWPTPISALPFAATYSSTTGDLAFTPMAVPDPSTDYIP